MVPGACNIDLISGAVEVVPKVHIVVSLVLDVRVGNYFVEVMNIVIVLINVSLHGHIRSEVGWCDSAADPKFVKSGDGCLLDIKPARRLIIYGPTICAP